MHTAGRLVNTHTKTFMYVWSLLSTLISNAFRRCRPHSLTPPLQPFLSLLFTGVCGCPDRVLHALVLVPGIVRSLALNRAVLLRVRQASLATEPGCLLAVLRRADGVPAGHALHSGVIIAPVLCLIKTLEHFSNALDRLSLLAGRQLLPLFSSGTHGSERVCDGLWQAKLGKYLCQRLVNVRLATDFLVNQLPVSLLALFVAVPGLMAVGTLLGGTHSPTAVAEHGRRICFVRGPLREGFARFSR